MPITAIRDYLCDDDVEVVLGLREGFSSATVLLDWVFALLLEADGDFDSEVNPLNLLNRSASETVFCTGDEGLPSLLACCW